MERIAHVLLLSALGLLAGCTPAQNRAAAQGDEGDRLTVGTVQKEIRIGMSGAEVAAALGSPNMVTTDEQRREVWVYDKMATDVNSSSSSGGVWLLLIAAGGESASRSTSQRTLTVIIKFDENKNVRDFAYQSSKF